MTLTNGKFALCADLLTETNGGVFTELFQALNPQRVAVGEVVTEAAFLLLKPEEPQDP